MPKEAFVIPRDVLVETELLPPTVEQETLYTPLAGTDNLERLINLAETHGEYRERGGENDVEKDVSVQQLIMYGFVRLPDGQFMIYQRGSDDYDEERLAGKVSVGIGGHMERTDLSLEDSFYRELEEEATITLDGLAVKLRDDDDRLDLDTIKKLVTVTPAGLIKDERDEVGQVHLGVACCIQPTSPRVEIQIRTDTGESVRSWYLDGVEYLSLVASREIQPEGWTQIVVDHEVLGRPQGLHRAV